MPARWLGEQSEQLHSGRDRGQGHPWRPGSHKGKAGRGSDALVSEDEANHPQWGLYSTAAWIPYQDRQGLRVPEFAGEARGRAGCSDDITVTDSWMLLQAGVGLGTVGRACNENKQNGLCLNKKDLEEVTAGLSGVASGQLAYSRLFMYVRETCGGTRNWQEGLPGILSRAIFCVLRALHRL